MTIAAFAVLLALNAPRSAKPCQPKIPESLNRDLAVMFPFARVMTDVMLSVGDRRILQRERPGQCPGVAALDFFGDGKKDYALVLAHGTKSRMANLVLARPETTGHWSFQLIEEANQGIAVVFSVPPGDYTDVYGESKLHAPHEAIGFSGIESWTVLFAWTGSTIDKIWTQD
jgi:hypothetical protein